MHADSEGRTPLHWAVDRGHLDVTELLLGRNADVNAKVFINECFNAIMGGYLILYALLASS